MKSLPDRLLKTYLCAMHLYPKRYLKEFGDERVQVFAEAVNDAAPNGTGSLLQLTLRELRDFPKSWFRSFWKEWEGVMKNIGSGLEEERFSWLGLIFGLWPFLFAGPFMALLPYLPKDVEQIFNLDSPGWLATVIVSALLGIWAGWKNGFPRWFYPYLMAPFLAISVVIMGVFSKFFRPMPFNPWLSTLLIFIGVLVLGVGMLFLLKSIPATRKIYNDLTRDWTRMSFGLCVYIAFGVGIYTGDHLPPFEISVVFPSLIVVLAAAVYLFCRRRVVSDIVLIVTALALIIIKTVVPGQEGWSIWPALMIAGLLIAPALIRVFFRPRLLEG